MYGEFRRARVCGWGRRFSIYGQRQLHKNRRQSSAGGDDGGEPDVASLELQPLVFKVVDPRL